jgi:hypothetical protein
VREKCDDENPIFPGFFLKHFTLDPRGFDLRSFLRANCSFFSRKTCEMKIDLCRRGKDREVSAKIPEDFAVRGVRMWTLKTECPRHSPSVSVGSGSQRSMKWS